MSDDHFLSPDELHLRNVCLVDGQPPIFGALEFKESLAITDTQYVLAYVPMVLLHRDRGAQACLVLSRYLERRPDHDGLSLSRLFVSVGAAVRAKFSLSIAAFQHTEATAQSYSFTEALAPGDATFIKTEGGTALPKIAAGAGV